MSKFNESKIFANLDIRRDSKVCLGFESFFGNSDRLIEIIFLRKYIKNESGVFSPSQKQCFVYKESFDEFYEGVLKAKAFLENKNNSKDSLTDAIEQAKEEL